MSYLARCAAAGALMLLVLPIGPASAHAAYKDSNPADKSSVSSPPSEVWAEFTEPPAQSSRLEIFDPCGERVDSGSSSVTAYRITTSMSSDKQGTYTARFYVTSDLDSHPTTGSFSFTSTGGAPCPGSAEETQEQGGSGKGESAGGSEDTNGSKSSGAEGSEVSVGSSTAAKDAGPSEVAPGDDGQSQRKGGNGKHKDGKHGQKKAQGKNANRSTASGPPVEPEKTDVPPAGDIPMDWLMVSFGIAGAVGAAGGKVYAGLMGPR